MTVIVAFLRLIRLPNLLIIVLTQYAIRYGIIFAIFFNFSGLQEIAGVGLKMSHLDLANELGTVREVITRMLKKLEQSNKICQTNSGIKIIDA